MPSVPECHVEVRPSPTAGNGLFATRDIPAGSTILIKARPLIGELDLARLQDTCHNCFLWAYKAVESCPIHGSQGQVPDCPGCAEKGEHPEVKSCTGCKKVKYCSKTCQKQSWVRYHKHECKILKDPSLPPLPSSVRAALQLASVMSGVAASEQDKAGVRRLQAHEYSTIDQLKEVEQYEATIASARDLFERLSPNDPEAFQIREYVGKILRNSLTLTTPTLDPLGIAFDPVACSANHSCEPNASVLFDVPHLLMRSLAPIKKDEEIFISYVDTTDPYYRRQAQLRLRYCFECECSKCRLGPSQKENQWLRPAEELPSKLASVCSSIDAVANFSSDPASYVGDSPAEKNMAILQGKAYQSLEQARAQKSPAASIQELESLMKLAKQSNMWPLTRQPYAAARVDIFAHLVQENHIGLALKHAAKTFFLIDPILYPQSFHPVRVVHTWSLVKTLISAYSPPNDPTRVVDPGVQELFEQGFDFVVPIWKISRNLCGDVVRSHGEGSRLAGMVFETAKEVQDGIGAQNLGEIERDPLGMWAQFGKWAYSLEY